MGQRLYLDAIFPLFPVTKEEEDIVHIYPLNDIHVHLLHKTCWCNPVLTDCPIEGLHYTHNSKDQREKYEQGELIKS